MLRWKVFAILTAAFGAHGTVMQLLQWPHDAFMAAINAAFLPFYSLGLLAYAFGKKLLTGFWWPQFTWLLGAWFCWLTAYSVWQLAPKLASADRWTAWIGMQTGLALGWALMFYIWLGVSRYSRICRSGQTVT